MHSQSESNAQRNVPSLAVVGPRGSTFVAWPKARMQTHASAQRPARVPAHGAADGLEERGLHQVFGVDAGRCYVRRDQQQLGREPIEDRGERLTITGRAVELEAALGRVRIRWLLDRHRGVGCTFSFS
jgi:hypothetical protein